MGMLSYWMQLNMRMLCHLQRRRQVANILCDAVCSSGNDHPTCTTLYVLVIANVAHTHPPSRIARQRHRRSGASDPTSARQSDQ